jgi:hypothetical protein
MLEGRLAFSAAEIDVLRATNEKFELHECVEATGESWDEGGEDPT